VDKAAEMCGAVVADVVGSIAPNRPAPRKPPPPMSDMGSGLPE
jgi:hypothetical protein